MARGKALNKDKLAAAWALDGVTTAVVARMLGSTPSAVRAAARRLKLPDRPGFREKRVVTDLDILASLWTNGNRVVDIAAVLGCSQGHITRLVKRSGLPRRRGAYAPRGSIK